MNLPLFVYGTLKRGFPAHARWCREAIAAHPALCPGSLLLHPDAYPVLVVRPELVLAVGSRDALRDAKIAAAPDADALRAARSLATRALAHFDVSDAGSGIVSGELLIFAAHAFPLAEIDAYEGYRPGMASLFARVLVRVTTPQTSEMKHAWAYVAGPLLHGAALSPIPSGAWPSIQ